MTVPQSSTSIAYVSVTRDGYIRGYIAQLSSFGRKISSSIWFHSAQKVGHFKQYFFFMSDAIE